MKKKQYFTFLSQLLAGLKSGKEFFIAKNTKAAKQLSTVFIQLGIIDYATHVTNDMLSKTSKKNKINNAKKNDIYLAFWFKKISKINDNRFYIDKNRFTKHSFSFHKIKILNKSNNYYKNKISYNNLVKSYPYWNVIYIISTPKGIMTSREAHEFKIGGYILCKIIL